MDNEFNYDAGSSTTDDNTLDLRYVLRSLFDANTILKADTDNTPVALTVTEQTLVGRLTGGNISAVAIGIADNNIVQIDHASVADNDYAKFTGSGLEGRSYAEVLSDLSGQAAGAFAWNSQNLTGIGSLTATTLTDGTASLSGGTLTGVTALAGTTEATIEAAIDTLANLTSVQGHTVTLTGNFIRVGAHSLTLTTTNTTDVTLPTTGTLATLAGAETLTNKTLTTPIIATLYADAGKTHLVTIQDATQTLVGRDTTDTLTNKTLTSPAINGTVTTTGLALPAFTLGGNMTVTGYAFDAGSGNAQINTTGGEVGLIVQSTQDTASPAVLTLRAVSASPALWDFISGIYAQGKNDNAETLTYGKILSRMSAITDGTESGRWEFYQLNAGSEAFTAYLEGDGVFVPTHTVRFDNSNDSAAVADQVSLGGYDISAGHRALAISSEEVVVVETDETKFSHKLPVRINGTTYNIMLCAT